MRNFLLATTLATLVVAIMSAPVMAKPGAVGTPALDFSLEAFHTGTTHTLSGHQGEVVLLFVIGYG